LAHPTQHLEWLNEIDIKYLEDPNPSSLSSSSEDNFAELARLQEIFVDILSSHCSRMESTKFLMKERYVDALSEEEKEMKEFVQTIIDGMVRYCFDPPSLSPPCSSCGPTLHRLSSNAKGTGAFKHLKKSIQELGG
jgi:hypothetical protein